MPKTVTVTCHKCHEWSLTFEVDGYKPLGGYCENCGIDFYELQLDQQDQAYGRACDAVVQDWADQADAT